MERVAIYCRLSEEDRGKQHQQDSLSIQNQKTMLIQHAREMGWEIAGVYSDDDYAGADRRRPEFMRLLKDAERRKFDIVLCKTQSRFTRELELVEKYIHGLFPLWGIRFVSIVDNADTANRGNKKSRQINGLVNEWYLEDMSENIRSVLTNRRENGYHIGSFALYGYRKDPERRGRLVIDEAAAAIVREVFALYASGVGKAAIARRLNDRGVPNPTAYKRLCGLRYRQSGGCNSALWRYAAIADMLENQIYIGNMVQGRYGSASYKTKQNRPRPRSQWYIVEGTHEPIISRELWERVQALLRQRAKPFGTGCIGLFARKAVCMNCGYAMRSSKSRGVRYLRCSCRHMARDACPGAFIQEEKLERLVLAELQRLTEKWLDVDAVAQGINANENLEAQQERMAGELAACRRRVEELSKGLRELYMDKVRGLIAEADYADMYASFTADRARLEQAVREAEAQLQALTARIAAGHDRRAIVARHVPPVRLSRGAVEAMIDQVRVGRRAPGTRDVPVEIRWRF